MWPLSVFLFLTLAGQQTNSGADKDYLRQAPLIAGQAKVQHRLLQQLDSRKVSTMLNQQNNTCFAMRSYVFRRQDGQAPVLVGTTTCTPASVLQQKQVSPRPQPKLVPAEVPAEEQK